MPDLNSIETPDVLGQSDAGPLQGLPDTAGNSYHGSYFHPLIVCRIDRVAPIRLRKSVKRCIANAENLKKTPRRRCNSAATAGGKCWPIYYTAPSHLRSAPGLEYNRKVLLGQTDELVPA